MKTTLLRKVPLLYYFLVSTLLLFSYFKSVDSNQYPLDRQKTADRLVLLQNLTCDEWNERSPEDCLQLTEPNCLAVDCDWHPGYPGPWCQFPIPEECIPTAMDRVSRSVSNFITSEYTDLNEIQVSAFWITVFSLMFILTTMVWAESKVPIHTPKTIGNYPELGPSENPNLASSTVQNPDLSDLSSSSTLIEGPFSAKKNDDYTEQDNDPLSTRNDKNNNNNNNNNNQISGSTGFRRRKNNDLLPHPAGSSRRYNSRSRASNVFLNNKFAQIILGPAPSWVVDLVVCVTLFVVGEYIKLWRLGTPAALTFDECHFGFFTSHYYKREYFFDIHPPFAKITFWFLGHILGHDPGPNGGDFQYKGQMGTAYENWYQYYPLRFVATLFGSGVIPVMYLALRAINIRPAGAIFGACLCLFDTLLISEARGILTDSQLIFWNCITIYAMFKLFTIPGYPAKEFAKKRERLLTKWMILTAFFCGSVFSVKFTSLATLGIVFMESFFGLFIIEKHLSFLRCLLCLGIGLAVWLFWWWAHFLILIYDTTESAWHTPQFQGTLINNAYHGKFPSPWFLSKTYELVYTMIKANAGILDPHDWGSRWYEWIVGRGKLLSAVNTSEELGYTQNWEISIFANPLIAVITLGSIAVSLTLCAFFCRYYHVAWVKTQANKNFVGVTLLCFCGWLANLLPYTGIARSTFVYHYLPGQLYVQVLSAFLLDRIVTLGPGIVRNLITATVGKRWSETLALPKRVQKFGGYASLGMYGILIVMLGLSWWFFTPWLYAIPLKPEQHLWRKYFCGK